LGRQPIGDSKQDLFCSTNTETVLWGSMWVGVGWGRLGWGRVGRVRWGGPRPNSPQPIPTCPDPSRPTPNHPIPSPTPTPAPTPTPTKPTPAQPTPDSRAGLGGVGLELGAGGGGWYIYSRYLPPPLGCGILDTRGYSHPGGVDYEFSLAVIGCEFEDSFSTQCVEFRPSPTQKAPTPHARSDHTILVVQVCPAQVEQLKNVTSFAHESVDYPFALAGTHNSLF
jgi:hypothetical protein